MTWSSYLPLWPLSVSPALWLALSLVVGVLVGEALVRYAKLPRIVGYIGIGLLLGPGGMGFDPPIARRPNGGLVVDLALGILLFELGSKVNLRWLKANPWLAATSLLEAVASFFVVLLLLVWFDVPAVTAAWSAASPSPPRRLLSCGP